LRDVGGFPPGNVTVLKDESDVTFRRTLVAFNDRVRSRASLPGTQTLLFVYYSGHADATALHLGRSRMDLTELGQLVRGSAATFRLLIVDACRSGVLTQVKGGRPVPPFEIPGNSGLQGEGFAFLTASSATEDAQESDELKSSFFTHALVSGLLGAADRDGDGVVVLDEAYRHAYAATLRATSRSVNGVQHPTFQYDFRGQDALVLTRLAFGSSNRSTLVFPAGVSFLVLNNDAHGDVVGEVDAQDVSRSLSVRSGTYFVRGRGADVLFEGQVTTVPGQRRRVVTDELHRAEYARLVRKGARESELAHGPELGVSARTQLPNATTPCLGFAAGYRLELRSLTFVGRLATCSSSFENDTIVASTRELDASVIAQYAWDVSAVSFGLGVGAGAAFQTQSFETAGTAPPRQSFSPFLIVIGSITVDVYERWYVAADARAETYLMNVQDDSASPASVSPAIAARGTFVGGLHF
jgi:hypothetical protein